jgi:carboxyl-terminal processing protease
VSEGRTPRKTPLSTGVFLVVGILLGISLFVLGNLVAHVGIFDLGSLLELPDRRAQGLADGDAQAAAVQVGARVEEVGATLDADALYGYTQNELDEASAAAIRSLLEASPDTHTSYYTPEEYAAYQRESEGEYAGIGVVLTLYDNRATVLQVYHGSPAADAEVAPGDAIVAIDGVRKDWEPTSASEAIHRAANETVEIVWERDGQERTTILALATVSVPTVVSHRIEQEGQNVGYIYLRRFNTEAADEIRAAIEQLELEGVDAYILDLRDNPGGFVDEAVELTSLFVREGEVVRVAQRDATRIYQVTGEVATEKPLAVLVNSASASASELSAAALQDHGRATIVGETTFGKGTVQNLHLLSFGGAVRYTIAHYLSPEGRTIEGVGVVPDVPVALEERDASADADADAEAGADADADAGASGTDADAAGEADASADATEPAHREGADSGEASPTPAPTLAEMLSDNLVSEDYRYRPGVDAQLDAALAALR